MCLETHTWSVCPLNGSSIAFKLVRISLRESGNTSAASVFSVHFQCITPVPVSASAGLVANVSIIVLITGQKIKTQEHFFGGRKTMVGIDLTVQGLPKRPLNLQH